MNREVQLYIDTVTDERNQLFLKLQGIILRLYPKAEMCISYKIPKYKVDAGWVSLGYWKGGVSLYTNGQHHIAAFKEQHPEITTGVGSIKFKVTDSIPEKHLEQVIKHAIEHPTPS